MLVLDELRCNGLLEDVSVARFEYHDEFRSSSSARVDRLLSSSCLPVPEYMGGREATVRMLALELCAAQFRICTTKVFFKACALAGFEERRDGLLYDVLDGCGLLHSRVLHGGV